MRQRWQQRPVRKPGTRRPNGRFVHTGPGYRTPRGNDASPRGGLRRVRRGNPARTNAGAVSISLTANQADLSDGNFGNGNLQGITWSPSEGQNQQMASNSLTSSTASPVIRYTIKGVTRQPTGSFKKVKFLVTLDPAK